MIKRIFIAALSPLVLVLLHSGCERHPASETIPGYAEKLAEKKKIGGEQAAKQFGTNPNPPEFFPGKPR